MFKTAMRLLTRFSLFVLLLTLPVFGAQVTLLWDAPPGQPAITNFTLYASTATITNSATGTISLQITNATTGTFSNLFWQTTYHFVVTSRQGVNESVFSNQATTNTALLPAPILLRIGP